MRGIVNIKFKQLAGLKVSERRLKKVANKISEAFEKHFEEKKISVINKIKITEEKAEITILFYKINDVRITKEVLEKKPDLLGVTKRTLEKLCDEMIIFYNNKGIEISTNVQVKKE